MSDQPKADILGTLRQFATDDEAAAIERAALKAGLIWKCTSCRWTNPADATTCTSCDLPFAEREWAVEVVLYVEAESASEAWTKVYDWAEALRAEGGLFRGYTLLEGAATESDRG